MSNTLQIPEVAGISNSHDRFVQLTGFYEVIDGAYDNRMQTIYETIASSPDRVRSTLFTNVAERLQSEEDNPHLGEVIDQIGSTTELHRFQHMQWDRSIDKTVNAVRSYPNGSESLARAGEAIIGGTEFKDRTLYAPYGRQLLMGKTARALAQFMGANGEELVFPANYSEHQSIEQEEQNVRDIMAPEEIPPVTDGYSDIYAKTALHSFLHPQAIPSKFGITPGELQSLANEHRSDYFFARFGNVLFPSHITGRPLTPWEWIGPVPLNPRSLEVLTHIIDMTVRLEDPRRP